MVLQALLEHKGNRVNKVLLGTREIVDKLVLKVNLEVRGHVVLLDP